MNTVDPRDLSDIDMLLHIAMGPLPKRGWDRRRVIVRRLAQLIGIAAAVVVVGWVAIVYVTAVAG